MLPKLAVEVDPKGAVEVDPKGAVEVDPKGVAEPAGTTELVMDMGTVGTTDMRPVGTADVDGIKGADSALCGVVAEVDTKNVLIRLPRPSFRTRHMIMLL